MGLGKAIIEWFNIPNIINASQDQFASKIMSFGDDTPEAETQSTAVINNAVPKGQFRPLSFDEYVGQARAKKLLKAYIENIKLRNIVMPHILIHSAPGLGKTTLARIVAKELGKELTEVISVGQDLDNYILDIKGNVLLLDEIHRVSRQDIEPLYPVMEDFKLYYRHLEPFTIIGATTEIGEIIKDRKPLYDRFKIKIELEDYTAENIKQIIKQYASKKFPNDLLPDSTFDTISTNARFVPRRAISLLESSIYLNSIDLALYSNQIIRDGLTEKDCKVLQVLSQNEKGIGLQALASTIGTSEANFQYELEPYLLKLGLILRTPRGRKITEKGKNTLKVLSQV